MSNTEKPPESNPASVAPVRNATFLQTMKAVFWSFLGIRKHSEHEKDVARLNPIHVILAGILAAAIFVFTLLMIVRSVVH